MTGSPSFEDEVERFRDLPGATSEECALLCFLGRKVMLTGGSADEVAQLAARAVRNLDFTEPGAHTVWLIGTVLWLPARAGLHEVVDSALNDAIELAARSGSANTFAWTSVMRGLMRHVAGDLRTAEADARAALDSGGTAGPFPDAPLTPLIESLADQGKIAEAEAMLAECGLSDEMPAARPYTVLLTARGRLRAAAGDMAAARADLDRAVARLTAAGSGGVSGLDARLEAALAAHAMGDELSARRISDDALAAAQAWQGERALGGALRVAGLLRGGAEGITLLEQAVLTLAVSPARLWEARAQVDLGAALRRSNRRKDSRPPLRRGIELAERCGATPLAELARRELAASGGRVPPREARGAAQLTPSEVRVAQHAAAGLSNPQIAQRLFVTIKTVEMHLSNAYRKLDIRSRHELQRALEAPASP